MPLENICEALNAYDVGVYILPPVNFNHEFALPNKFFEFVQARLAVAIGPSPEMSRLVREHGFGVVAPSFEPKALADMLNALTVSDLMAMKKAADQAAPLLSFETEGLVILKALDKLQILSGADKRGSK